MSIKNLNAEDKAKELVNAIRPLAQGPATAESIALIVCDEVIAACGYNEYWEAVKEVIENM